MEPFHAQKNKTEVDYMKASNYSETSRYRCLNEHYPRQSEELYLLMCGIERCAPDKEIWDRDRDGYHLHIIISGSGIVRVDGKTKTLKSSQMFLLKPGQRTAYSPVPEDPWTYCWIAFDGLLGERLARAAGFGPGVFWRDSLVDSMRFYRVCDQVLNTPQLSAYAAIKRLGLMLEYIGLAAESFAMQHNDHSDHKPLYHREDYIRHALEYIQNNYSSITVSDVSDYLGIDRSYFAAIFKQGMGISPSEYLLQMRMRQSSHMLLNQAMAIQDIAHYVGYEDSLTFSKAFKRFFGVSPRYYRETPAEDRPKWEAVVAARKK